MHFQREFIEISIPQLPTRIVIKDNREEKITADAHMHAEIELIYVIEGAININTNNKIVSVKKGELVFINSMVVHSTSIPGNLHTKILVLQFNSHVLYSQQRFAQYETFLSFISFSSCMFYVFSEGEKSFDSEILDLIKKIIIEFTNKEITYELSIKSYLYRILSLLYRMNILELKTPELLTELQNFIIKIEPVIEFTEINFMKKISAYEISQIVHFNYSYFCRIFKKATGKSYLDYLNYVRIMAAEDLLRNTDLSISNILERTGFTSLSYLNRMFRHYMGINPSAYRKQIATQPLQ